MATPTELETSLKDLKRWWRSVPARVSEKPTRNTYQGLMPSIRARIRPVAGYQATNPRRVKKMTSGRHKKRYTWTKQAESRAWRRKSRLGPNKEEALES